MSSISVCVVAVGFMSLFIDYCLVYGKVSAFTPFVNVTETICQLKIENSSYRQEVKSIWIYCDRTTAMNEEK